MTLEKAISFVINKEGIEIIGETRFVNYLSDLQAFDMPAVKRIVVTMVSGGYAEKLKHSLTTEHYQLDVNDAKSRLVNNEGFQANLVEYVLNCLLFATKKTTLVPVIPVASSTTAASASVSVKAKPVTLKPIQKSVADNSNDGHYCFPTLDLLSSRTRIDPEDRSKYQPLRSALSTKAFQDSYAYLPICLGVTEQNEVHVVDLAELPHLLVAGSTGTGKSVLLHAMILSMLYKLLPDQVRFVLIDPQRVELSSYSLIQRFYLAKSSDSTEEIVSEPDEVSKTLVSLTEEIDYRYKLLNKALVRNIVDYNKKWGDEIKLNHYNQSKCELVHLPRIVIIIDEFSSYAQSISYFQDFISYITEKGRFVGVHLILSTNAVGAQVLTPALKSLFPAKIAFDVPQVQDSVRILDTSGAENLNQKGRLLYKNGNKQVCLQCPYVHNSDIHNVCNFIFSQREAAKLYKKYLLDESIVKDEDKSRLEVKVRDPLFEEAVRFVVMGNSASTSQLQRRYEIGYNRAGRLMDQMERAGIVGPAVGSKPRQVLVSPMDIDLLFDGGMPYIPKQIRTPLSSYQGEMSKSDPQSKPNQPKKKKHNYFEIDWFGVIMFIVIMLIALAIVLSE